MIQAFELDNPISYGHAMRFLLHVVAHVSHYVVFYTTLPYLFIHSSQFEFRNLDYFIPCRSLIVSFDSSSCTRKSDIIRPRYEVLSVCAGSQITFYTTLPYLFIHSSQLEFRNLDIFIPCRSLSYLFIHSSQFEFRIMDFFIPCHSLYRKLWFKLLNFKIRYHTATLRGFYSMWWLMSLFM